MLFQTAKARGPAQVRESPLSERRGSHTKSAVRGAPRIAGHLMWPGVHVRVNYQEISTVSASAR